MTLNMFSGKFDRNALFIIPARSGSKGLPGKNIMDFCGKPLIAYSIEYALQFVPMDQIHVSTDALEIAKIAEEYGVRVQFMRPSNLSGDAVSMDDVIRYIVGQFSERNILFNKIVLLQPTSPFRSVGELEIANKLFDETNPDLMLAVVKSKASPYFNLFEDNGLGYIQKISENKSVRRQDNPNVYLATGNFYIINVNSLLTSKISNFKRIMGHLMPDCYSIDIDTKLDFQIAEIIYKYYKDENTNF